MFAVAVGWQIVGGGWGAVRSVLGYLELRMCSGSMMVAGLGVRSGLWVSGSGFTERGG